MNQLSCSSVESCAGQMRRYSLVNRNNLVLLSRFYKSKQRNTERSFCSCKNILVLAVYPSFALNGSSTSETCKPRFFRTDCKTSFLCRKSVLFSHLSRPCCSICYRQFAIFNLSFGYFVGGLDSHTLPTESELLPPLLLPLPPQSFVVVWVLVDNAGMGSVAYVFG